MKPRLDRFGRVTLALVLLVGAAAGVGTGATGAEARTASASQSITVAVQADGSAEWTVVNRVSLPTDAARTAFDELADNETRRAQLRRNTVATYAAVANASSRQLDRRMNVTDGEITLRREGGTGVITVSFEWTGFARTDGQRLLVGDVFTGGYPLAANRTLTIEPPAEYRLASHNVSTANATVTNGTVTWEGPVIVRPSIELAYRKITPTSTATPTGTATGGSATGFGAGAALLALVAAALLALRRE